MPIPSINWPELAKAVRVRRALLNIDQKDAAKEMTMPASTLSRLENGKTVSADNFMTLCWWLEREPNDFCKLY